MALLFMDSFDHYGTVVTDKWTSLGSSYLNDNSGIATVGRRSTKGWRAGNTASGNANDFAKTLYKTLSPTTNICIVGMAFRPVTAFTNIAQGLYSEILAAGGTVAPCLVAIRYGGVTQCWLKLNADGTISPVRNNSPAAGTVLGTTSAALALGSYTHIEVMVAVHNTTGIVKIRFNGTEVLSLTAQNTQSTGNLWNEIRLGSVGPVSGGSVEWNYDDLYVLDGNGSAPWNAFLGDCRLDASSPPAAGAKSDWIPLSGTNNALMVDDPDVGDSDVTYVSSVTPGATDTYVLPDLPVVGAQLKGVQLNLLLRKEDAGSCPLTGVVRHAGVDYPTAAIESPSTTYGYRMMPLQTNPGTGVAWTEAGFNAAEFGVMRE